MLSKEEIKGYKPTDFSDYVWLPYIPLMEVPPIDTEVYLFYIIDYDNKCYLYYKLSKFKL